MIARFFLIAAGLTLGACLADIRPEMVRTSVSAGDAARGRELLQRATSVHGAPAWRTGQIVRVRVTDVWPEGLQTSLVSPWPATVQRFDFEFQSGTDHSRVRFLDGPAKGETWGIQQWVTYKTINGERKFAEDSDIKFWLPTLQYFVELPFRITAANVAAYAGEQIVNGQPYELVVASWNTLAPQGDVDQYLLYIHKESGTLDYAQYTVRDMAPFATGLMHYADLRRAAGVQLAHRLRTIDSLEDHESYLHEMTLESIEMATDLQIADLVPEPSRTGTK